MPVILFANGHSATYQHLSEKYGVAPVMLHSTYQVHAEWGKRMRLREQGLYAIDPPERFNAPDRRYLMWVPPRAGLGMPDVLPPLILVLVANLHIEQMCAFPSGLDSFFHFHTSAHCAKLCHSLVHSL